MKKLDKLTEYVFAQGLSSAMNKTKWREVAAQLTSNTEFVPRVRVGYLEYLMDEEHPPKFAHLDWE